MSGNRPIFVGAFSDAERRVMECIFESTWSLATSVRLMHSDADKAERQRAQLAMIVTGMMSRREDSIGDLSDAAFRQFKASEPPARRAVHSRNWCARYRLDFDRLETGTDGGPSCLEADGRHQTVRASSILSANISPVESSMS